MSSPAIHHPWTRQSHLIPSLPRSRSPSRSCCCCRRLLRRLRRRPPPSLPSRSSGTRQAHAMMMIQVRRPSDGDTDPSIFKTKQTPKSVPLTSDWHLPPSLPPLSPSLQRIQRPLAPQAAAGVKKPRFEGLQGRRVLLPPFRGGALKAFPLYWFPPPPPNGALLPDGEEEARVGASIRPCARRNHTRLTTGSAMSNADASKSSLCSTLYSTVHLETIGGGGGGERRGEHMTECPRDPHMPRPSLPNRAFTSGHERRFVARKAVLEMGQMEVSHNTIVLC